MYGNGVQQGDNIAPILFIYIMQAAFETLGKCIGYEKPEFRYFPDSKNSGRFIRQATKSKGIIFHTDSPLCHWWSLPNWHEGRLVKSNSQKVYIHFACFRLQMHIWSADQKLKTKAMYFPLSIKCSRKWHSPTRPTAQQWRYQYPLHKILQILGFIHHLDLSDEMEI